jgi:hypothetical protein
MKAGPIFILVLCTCNISQSQARPAQSGSSAHSSLTVTATVTPSVWLVTEPDGKRDLIVANAPDPRESFSHAPAIKARGKGGTQTKKQTSSAAISQKPPRNQDDTGVQFNFPSVSGQFDVTQKTVLMDVSEGGKTEARPVTVTTIVAQ